MTMEIDTIPCGDYDLFERIGSGGMGAVWRGVHRESGRRVAVKVMSAELAAEESSRDWFRREIRAQARLTHPHIVRLFDLGWIDSKAAEAAEDHLVEGSPYYVMEYSPEGTLRSGVVVTGWWAVESVLQQVLEGLAYAHAREVVHRDLKPGNILCFSRQEPAVKVADFGLAFGGESRNEGYHKERLGPAGTPDYMAPEQIRGEWRRYGAWTDLYAVGCIAYELISGRRPYPGEDTQAVARAHLERPVPEFRPMFPVPDGTGEWIATLMAKEPPGRYWCAADASWALEKLSENFSTEEEGGADSGEKRPAALRRGSLDEETAATETTPSTSISTPRNAGRSDVGGEATGRRPEEARTKHIETPGEPPPFPADWHRPSRSEVPGEPAVPLGLFGLKEVPLVDREQERDILWDVLRSTVEGEQLRVALVSGEEGTGKSRLVEWVCNRAVEVGACVQLKAKHSRQGGPDEGLTGMLQSVFNTWELTRGEVREQLWRTLGAWADEETTETMLELEVRALTEMLRPAGIEEDRPPSYRFSALAEQLAIIERVLQQIAQRRPVVLWLDDPHWTYASLEFVRYLLGSEPEYGLTVMMTVPNLAHGRSGASEDVLRDLSENPRVTSLELTSLTRRDHRELVSKMVDLEPDLAEQVVDRTGGTPLFAVELVRDWVERDLLEPGPDGYGLRPGAEGRIPDDLHIIWERRVNHLTEPLSEETREAATEAVELGAVFGVHVDKREWQVACAEADLRPIELLFDRMIEQGLVFPEPGGWRFVHGMLVESLVRRAREAGRHARMARACAAAVEECYPERLRETAERRASFLYDAEELEIASDVYLLAVEKALQVGNLTKGRELLDRREAILDELDVDQEDRARVESAVLEARLALDRGRHREASERIERLLEIASDNEWQSILAEARVQQGKLRQRQGRQSDAIDSLEAAEEIFRALGDTRGLANCLQRKGVVYDWGGRYEAALDFYEDSRELFESIGDVHQALQSERAAIYPLLYIGELDQAEEDAERILERAREIGNRWSERECLNQLGEIARYEERWDDARRRYEEYLKLNEKLGLFDRKIARLNLAMVAVGAGELEEARETFVALEQEVKEEGAHYILPTINLGKLAVVSASGDWDSWNRVYEETRRVLGSVETREHDQLWLARRAQEAVEEADDAERAEKLSELIERLEEEID